MQPVKPIIRRVFGPASRTLLGVYLALLLQPAGCRRANTDWASQPIISTGIQTATVAPVLSTEGSSIKAGFPLVNSTGRPTKILGVSKSCTCISLFIDGKSIENGMEIQPHKQSILTMASALKGRTGPIVATCTLENDHNLPWRFELRTEIHDPISIDNTHLNLGQVDAESIVVRQFEVSTLSRQTEPSKPILTCSNIQFAFKEVNSVIEQLSQDLTRRRTLIEFTISIPSAVGPHSSIIRASVNGGPEARHEASEVCSWVTKAPYIATPAALYFDIRKSQNRNDLAKALTIKRSDGAPFRVVDIHCDVPFVHCASQMQLDQELNSIDVTIDPPPDFDKQYLASMLIVETNKSDFPQFQIPLLLVR